MGAGGGVREQQRDVLGPDVPTIDAIRRSGASLDPPGDLAFGLPVGLLRAALEQDGDLREVARRPCRGSGEDDVVHAPAAKRLGAGLAHCPADRLEQVGLAAAVGPDDPGETGLDSKLSRFYEALEAAELEPPDPQLFAPRAPRLAAERLVEAGLQLIPGR